MSTATADVGEATAPRRRRSAGKLRGTQDQRTAQANLMRAHARLRNDPTNPDAALEVEAAAVVVRELAMEQWIRKQLDRRPQLSPAARARLALILQEDSTTAAKAS